MARPYSLKTVNDEFFSTEKGLLELEKWAAEGLIYKEICERLNIHRSTFFHYLRKYPEARQAIARGRASVNEQVEAAMFKSACGFYVTETTEDFDGRVRKTTRFVNPNTSAQIFWLKNRNSTRWQDRREIEHKGDVPVVIKDDIAL